MSGFGGLTVDDAVVRRAQAGDVGAQSVVFQRFAPAVYNLAYRLSQSAAVADDLTQETFVAVLRKLPDFRFSASLATWIRRIAVNCCLMHLRTAWQRRQVPLDDHLEPTVADGSQAIGLQRDLSAALAELSPEARAVVWLHDVEGYTHKEIAMLMQKSVSFSKSALSRAHARLRRALDEPGAAGDGVSTPARLITGCLT